MAIKQSARIDAIPGNRAANDMGTRGYDGSNGKVQSPEDIKGLKGGELWKRW